MNVKVLIYATTVGKAVFAVITTMPQIFVWLIVMNISVSVNLEKLDATAHNVS